MTKIKFISSLIFLLSGCSTITERTHPRIDPSQLNGSKLNGKTIIRFIAIPQTEFVYPIENSLLKVIKNSNLFTEVDFLEVDPIMKRFDPKMSDEILFKEAYAQMPPLSDADHTIDFIVRAKKAETNFLTEAWKIFTFLIVPAKRHFEYSVSVRLNKKDGANPKEIVLNENFRYNLSSIPNSKSHFQITWEKEPIVNLMTVALQQFQSTGDLK